MNFVLISVKIGNMTLKAMILHISQANNKIFKDIDINIFLT